MSKQRPVYHYTSGLRLAGILRDGHIRPSTAGLLPPMVPAVWLSTATAWENAATKGAMQDGVMRPASLTEMIGMLGGLVRIEIDPDRVDLIPPALFRQRLRLPAEAVTRLKRAASLLRANPAEWRAVAGCIPAAAFMQIETATRCDPLAWHPFVQDDLQGPKETPPSQA